jgi:hypothetical protein
MSDTLTYLSMHFPLAVLIFTLVAAYSNFITKKMDKETKNAKEYVDLKVYHLSSQIDDLKKSMDTLSTSISSLCKQLYKVQ